MTGPQYMLISALGFALMGALVKVSGAAGVPLLQIILVRAIISVALSLADIRRAGAHPLGTRRWLLLARGTVGFLALTCVFYAVLHLTYAQATILQYLHPIFTAALAFLFLKEVPTRPTIICVVLSLFGLVAMLWPAVSASGPSIDSVAVASGLAGAFGSGLAYTIVRKLAPTEHPAVIVMYFPMVCVPATIVLGAADFVWPSPLIWLAMVGVGVFAQVGQVALTKAMRTDTASRASSLSYLQIVFATILGYAAFGEAPSSYTILGGALILLGAAISARAKTTA